MRTCKKECYTKILENNKDNIKGIWNILNSVIRDTPRYINYPQYFICIVFVMYLGHQNVSFLQMRYYRNVLVTGENLQQLLLC